MRDQRQRQSAHDADHPRRKVRAENVDGQRMVTGSARRGETKEDNCESDGDKLEDCSNGSHRFGCLTKRGCRVE